MHHPQPETILFAVDLQDTGADGACVHARVGAVGVRRRRPVRGCSCQAAHNRRCHETVPVRKCHRRTPRRACLPARVRVWHTPSPTTPAAARHTCHHTRRSWRRPHAPGCAEARARNLCPRQALAQQRAPLRARHAAAGVLARGGLWTLRAPAWGRATLTPPSLHPSRACARCSISHTV
jgi:hypothetical protein